ncbi:MAG TPA: bifunctional phosphoribosyl-AMP cyclohydrolase/phosphoribosyl-ATP diphosphatase, partial [Pantoea agglomerans]|nr:bifunctional phosphoribosyl-AMP cyclohydrolase/phosphoribosyl-ATP diphosphatase [Pantoea agglomerans]
MLTEQQQALLDWDKTQGMMPVIVQHFVSGEVLMHGYINQSALEEPLAESKVTSFSLTKNRLWTKGATFSNFLQLLSITPDCDNDTLLVLSIPTGS